LDVLAILKLYEIRGEALMRVARVVLHGRRSVGKVLHRVLRDEAQNGGG
jgi:hypothetical protein